MTTIALCADPRTRLAKAGQPCETVFVITKGVLVQQWERAGGRRQIVRLHVPGDVCGLAAFFDGHVDHDVIALSPVTYVPVRRKMLSRLVRDAADLSQAVWREMSRDLAISAAWITNLGPRTAAQRIAFFACEMEARLRAAGQDTHGGLEWPGSQADLCAVLGLSLVHLNKTLAKLEANRLVSRGRRIRFHDIKKLGDIADFDPSYLAVGHETLSEMLLASIGACGDAQNDTVVRRSPAYRGSVATP